MDDKEKKEIGKPKGIAPDKAAGPFYKRSQSLITSMFGNLPARGLTAILKEEQENHANKNQTTLTGKNDAGITWTYTGEVRNELFHGKGKITWSSGEVYEGDFVDSKMHGKGKYTWANGKVYEGDWVDGKKADKETFLSATVSAGNVSLEDGKFDLDQLRRISQESQQKGQIDLERKVLQYCDPKKIAQDLVEKLKTNAAYAAKEGRREASSSSIIYYEDYNHPQSNVKSPFGNLDRNEEWKLSKVLFEMVKKNITDNNIELTVKDDQNREYVIYSIHATLSW